MRIVIVIFLGLFITENAVAENDNIRLIRTCREINNNINYYTKIRRSGGNAREMAIWQKERNKYEDQYIKMNCIKVKNDL